MPAKRTKVKATKAPALAEFEEFYIHADEPIYTTGVVCKLLMIPIWVLKQLDSHGVVSPPRNKAGQSRLYSKRELKLLDQVWYLMNERNVKVDGIKVILELEAERF
ncbi:MAG: MerR family transcriptional regulator [Candidatus Melainabacteria bacterium]|nr:MerR family transcriptional regulator [Candidatus Melainabacteria bacterium]